MRPGRGRNTKKLDSQRCKKTPFQNSTTLTLVDKHAYNTNTVNKYVLSNSDRDKHRCVACHDRNPSPPSEELRAEKAVNKDRVMRAERQITCRKYRK